MTSDRDEEPRGFKVVDRRPFDADGEERTDVPEAGEAGTGAGEGSGERAGPAPDGGDSGSAADAAASRDAGAAQPGKLDLESFIKSLLAAGLFHTGALGQEGQDPPPPDLVGARQMLDTLVLLREKTRGNLSEAEEQLFPDAIGELALTIGLRLLAPSAMAALGLEEGGSLDAAKARARIDALGELIDTVREATRPDAVSVLESALTDLRMRFVAAAGA